MYRLVVVVVSLFPIFWSAGALACGSEGTRHHPPQVRARARAGVWWKYVHGCWRCSDDGLKSYAVYFSLVGLLRVCSTCCRICLFSLSRKLDEFRSFLSRGTPLTPPNFLPKIHCNGRQWKPRYSRVALVKEKTEMLHFDGNSWCSIDQTGSSTGLT